MSAREYETDREEPQRLILMRSTRDAGGRADQNEGSPKVSFFHFVQLQEALNKLP